MEKIKSPEKSIIIEENVMPDVETAPAELAEGKIELLDEGQMDSELANLIYITEKIHEHLKRRHDHQLYRDSRKKWTVLKKDPSFLKAKYAARDIKNPQDMTPETDWLVGTFTKRWSQYWYRRLKPEFDILPSNIQPLLRKMIDGVLLNNSEMLELGEYVRARIGVIDAEEWKQEVIEKYGAFKQDQVTPKKEKTVNAEKPKVELGVFEKTKVMDRLKSRLSDIDARKDYPEYEARRRIEVEYDSSTRSLFAMKDDDRYEITFADLAADTDWGLRYRPSDNVPPEIWRKIRKICDITEAKIDISELLSREVFVDATLKDIAPYVSSERLEQGIRDGNRLFGGHAAEKMAKNIIGRYSINNQMLGIRVEAANPIEDGILKYDFKIFFPAYLRGVATETDDLPREEFIEAKRKIGVQFTLNKSISTRKLYKTYEGKMKLGDESLRKLVRHPVDDIVLVNLPFDAYEFYKKWLDDGKPPGGPEQYLSREQKIELFKKVTHGRINLTDEELEKLII